MKCVFPLFVAAGVLFAAGCKKNSSSSGTPEDMSGTTNSMPPATLNSNTPAGGMYTNTNAAPMTTNGPAK